VLELLRYRNFSLLVVGGVISSLGDWFLVIALPFYVYGLTGSALATGGTFIAESLPSVLFGSLAGVFVDRWDRRRTMIVADLLRAFVLLGLLAVHSSDTVWIVFAVSFVQASIGQFFEPAKGALIPLVVGEKDLLAANSLSSVSTQLTMLVGPILGGGVLALFGLSAVVAADSVSFLFSAVLISLVAVMPRARLEKPSEDTPSHLLVRVWREYREGLTLMRRNAVVVALLFAMGTASLGQGLINVQLSPFVKDLLHGDSVVLGWVISAQGIGGLVGAIALGSLGQTFSFTKVLATGLILAGLVLIIIVNVTVLPVVLALIALIGVAVVVFVIRLQTVLQVAVSDEYRGRVLGAYGTTQSVLLLVGMAASGALSTTVGTVSTLELAGLLYAAGGVATAFVLPRALRTAGEAVRAA
jgi:MFS family permease